jgi:hypothetical protein
MRQEDKPVARPESQGKPAKNDPGLADEVYIPDYVMLDFGFSPKEGVPAGSRPLHSGG